MVASCSWMFFAYVADVLNRMSVVVAKYVNALFIGLSIFMALPRVFIENYCMQLHHLTYSGKKDTIRTIFAINIKKRRL
jgi:hypothetical protein